MSGESLYSLSSKLARINDEIFDAGGEVTDELEQRLDDTGLALQDRVHGIVRWVFNLDGQEEAIDKELARLQARKKAVKNLTARLKGYVETGMKVADKNKMEFDTFEAAVVKNPPSVEIQDEKAIPAKFVETITMQRIDKKAILVALKAGEEVTGAVLIKDKTRLRLK
jgi:hypothetical protein